MKLFRRLVMLAGLTLACGAGAALAEEPPEAEPPREVPQFSMTWSDRTRLLVQSTTETNPETVGLSIVAVGGSRWPARIDVTAPPGYSLGSADREAWIGDGGLSTADDARRPPLSTGSGRLFASAAPSPGSSCAPGSHAARWRLELRGWQSAWDRATIPIYVDRVSGGGWRLRLCVPKFLATQPGRYLIFSLAIRGPVTSAAGRGTHTFTARVTPFDDARSKPEPRREYELRSTTLVPHQTTMSGQYDVASSSARLSGVVSGAGRPRAGVQVFVGVFDDPEFGSFRVLGPARTDARGAWSYRAPLRQARIFVAAVDARATPCKGRSSSPAGCIGQTVAPPPSVSVALSPG